MVGYISAFYWRLLVLSTRVAAPGVTTLLEIELAGRLGRH